MRLQFASQFFDASAHMSFGKLLKPVAPTLMLLGNTVNPWTVGGRNFLREAAANYDSVFIVPGPAEYASNRNECFRVNLRRLYDETAKYPNAHVLCQKNTTVGDVDLLGATLWTEKADTEWVRERMHRPAATDEQGDELVLESIRRSVAVNMRTSDREFFNGSLLEARMAPKRNRMVFASHFLPNYGCITRADIARGRLHGIEQITNDYRYLMRAPLQLWLCGAGVGGLNYWDSETGILFAKNARGNDTDAAPGYSAEMFMDVGTVAVRDRRQGIDALQIVMDDAERTDLPPVPAPDVDFFPEEDDPDTPRRH